MTKPVAKVSIGDYHIQGFVSDQGVANYLGIPYADVKTRFRAAQLIESSKRNGSHDATRYGPICPQNVDGPRQWRDHLYRDPSNPAASSTSEFDCLNLNVYTPGQSTGRSLPVLVWIHGGGWVVGDGGQDYGTVPLSRLVSLFNKGDSDDYPS